MPELQPHPTIPARVTFPLLSCLKCFTNSEEVLRTIEMDEIAQAIQINFKEVFVSCHVISLKPRSLLCAKGQGTESPLTYLSLRFILPSQYNSFELLEFLMPKADPHLLFVHPLLLASLPSLPSLKINARPTASLQDPTRTVN